jgi:hypothetical protein
MPNGFTSYRKAVDAQYNFNIAKTLTAMSLKADEITKKNITNVGRVDTEYMRGTVGGQIDVENREVIHGIGANYGIYQEMGTRTVTPGNFIRDNINNNQKDYEEIARAILGEGFNE